MRGHPSPEYLTAVAELMKATRAFIDGLRLYPRRAHEAENVLPALLSKSIVVAESVMCLIANGFDDEAYGLCRTIVEIRFVVRYLANKDTSERVKRYVEYFAKDNRRWVELIQKYFPDMNLRERVDADEIIEQAKTYKSHYRWHEKAIRELALEPDSFETKEDGSPLTDEFNYEVIYRWMSHYVHGTVLSIDPSHVTEYGDPIRIHRGKGRSNRASDALYTAFLSVQLNLVRTLRYLELEVPAALLDQYEKVINEYVQNV